MKFKSMHSYHWMIILGFLIFLPGSKFSDIASTVTTAVPPAAAASTTTTTQEPVTIITSIEEAVKSSALKSNTINDKTFLRTQSKRESPTIKLTATAATSAGASAAAAVSDNGSNELSALLKNKKSVQLTAEVKSVTSISPTIEITQANTNSDNNNNNSNEKKTENTSLSIARKGSFNKSANKAVIYAAAIASISAFKITTETPASSSSTTVTIFPARNQPPLASKLVATLASIESTTASSLFTFNAKKNAIVEYNDDNNSARNNDKSYKSLINNITIGSSNGNNRNNAAATADDNAEDDAAAAGFELNIAAKHQSLKLNNDAKMNAQIDKLVTTLAPTTLAKGSSSSRLLFATTAAEMAAADNEKSDLNSANLHRNSIKVTTEAVESATTTTTTSSTSTTTRTTRRPVPTTTLKPPPTIDDYQTIISQAGLHAYLPCNVKQLVKKPISWLRVRDGHILTVDQTTFIADQRFQSIYTSNPERWSLQIKYVQLKDEGTYECQVSTEPKASAIVQLRIVEPKTELIGESTRHVKAGSQVKLRCIISQALEPPLFINWFYNQKQIYLHNRRGWRTEIERIDLPTEMPATQATPQPPAAPTTTTKTTTMLSSRRGIQASSRRSGNGYVAATTRSYTLDAISLRGGNDAAAYKLPTASTMSAATYDSSTTTATAATATIGAATTTATAPYIAIMTAAMTTPVGGAAASATGLASTVASSSYKTTLTTTTMLPSSSFIKQITTASLIIPSVAKQDSGNYTCSPSNSAPKTVVLHVLNGEYSASAITSASVSWYFAMGNRFSNKYLPVCNLSTILLLTWFIKFVLLRIITNCTMSNSENSHSNANNSNGNINNNRHVIINDNFNCQRRQCQCTLLLLAAAAVAAKCRRRCDTNDCSQCNHVVIAVCECHCNTMQYQIEHYKQQKQKFYNSNNCSISNSKEAEMEDKT